MGLSILPIAASGADPLLSKELNQCQPYNFMVAHPFPMEAPSIVLLCPGGRIGQLLE